MAGDDRGNAIRSKQWEIPKTGIVRLRRERQLEG